MIGFPARDLGQHDSVSAFFFSPGTERRRPLSEAVLPLSRFPDKTATPRDTVHGGRGFPNIDRKPLDSPSEHFGSLSGAFLVDSRQHR
jgi:hypothetical protein